MTKPLHQGLTDAIIAVYHDVYNGTARTYPEFIYERAMVVDLGQKGIACQRQEQYQVVYKDKLVGSQRLDLFVADEVVVKTKAASQLTELHKAQARSYLRVANKEVGLLCNFGGAQPESEWVNRKSPSSNGQPDVGPPPGVGEIDDLISPGLAGEVFDGLYQVHTFLGPGFTHRIYADATYHELGLRGIYVRPRREYQVMYRGQSIGEIKFFHLQIEDDLMVFPVAVQDIDRLSIDNLRAWMEVKEVPVGVLANFYPVSLEYLVLRA